jgi:hypothetical protein
MIPIFVGIAFILAYLYIGNRNGPDAEYTHELVQTYNHALVIVLSILVALQVFEILSLAELIADILCAMYFTSIVLAVVNF